MSINYNVKKASLIKVIGNSLYELAIFWMMGMLGVPLICSFFGVYFNIAIYFFVSLLLTYIFILYPEVKYIKLYNQLLDTGDIVMGEVISINPKITSGQSAIFKYEIECGYYYKECYNNINVLCKIVDGAYNGEKNIPIVISKYEEQCILILDYIGFRDIYH